MKIAPQTQTTAPTAAKLDASTLSKGLKVQSDLATEGRPRDKVESAVDRSAIEKLLSSGLLDTKSFKLTCGDYNL